MNTQGGRSVTVMRFTTTLMTRNLVCAAQGIAPACTLAIVDLQPAHCSELVSNGKRLQLSASQEAGRRDGGYEVE
eukprot:2428340-Amphidinium_carterae.1